MTAMRNQQTRSAFSASTVRAVIKELQAPSKQEAREKWLKAVASRVIIERPDLAEGLQSILDVSYDPEHNPLYGLTIGEVGVCYEALTAMSDNDTRKASGQFFTPDDAAHFMAQQSMAFPQGTWMDPCCGVGNLAWHLSAVQNDPASFVRDRLVLIDIEETALISAVALIGAGYLASHDIAGLRALRSRAVCRDFLDRTHLPEHDFTIVNPPYARSSPKTSLKTQATRELFAYFLELIATTSQGFISVTPASYLSASKFSVLRDVLDASCTGGHVFVLDNVPDTLFRGYKFGSSNTSHTNFVRAAITVCAPTFNSWEITPILRWRAANRAHMFTMAPRLLSSRRIGPAGEWVKLAPGLDHMWTMLTSAPVTLQDLTVAEPTPYSLTVGTTPRYYISAAFRDLKRGSKTTLYFNNRHDRDKAAIVLNSSVPYLWWRALDGGITLPRRVLMSTPIPDFANDKAAYRLVHELQDTEKESMTTKFNAGMLTENVKRPSHLVESLNTAIMGYTPDLHLLYTEDMAANTNHEEQYTTPIQE